VDSSLASSLQAVNSSLANFFASVITVSYVIVSHTYAIFQLIELV
jgi:hypothetical protein